MQVCAYEHTGCTQLERCLGGTNGEADGFRCRCGGPKALRAQGVGPKHRQITMEIGMYRGVEESAANKGPEQLEHIKGESKNDHGTCWVAKLSVA